jgi:hypothetical protein
LAIPAAAAEIPGKPWPAAYDGGSFVDVQAMAAPIIPDLKQGTTAATR